MTVAIAWWRRRLELGGAITDFRPEAVASATIIAIYAIDPLLY
jgi:hypothetical protein